MATAVLMPKMSDTMEEGVIAKWLKNVGDIIEGGDIIAEIETDKATMEFEATDDEEGVLLYKAAEEGGTIAVDALLLIVGEKGEDFQDILKADENKTETTPTPEASPAQKENPQALPALDGKAHPVIMPKMSDTMEEGVIAKWHKKVGDNIEAGDIIAEIETDKATMEFEATDDEEGTLLYQAAEEGGSVIVDGLLAVVGEKGADFQAVIAHFNQQSNGSQTSDVEKATIQNPQTETTNKQQATSNTTTPEERIKISPLARKLAQEKGYDIAQIKGTGEGGRIVKRDIESFVPQKATPQTQESTAMPIASSIVGEESFEEKPLSQMRKTIARRLSESKYQAPHFYLTMEIRMDKAIEARKAINEYSPVKVSFNDMVIKAVALALRQNPDVNASWRGDKIRYNHHIHVGVAVAIPEGLLVPVVRFADAQSLSQIAAETKNLAQKAKDKKLQPVDWEGSTFSVSNLGMYGIEEFTAIINPPDACILAIGGIAETPVVENGELKAGNVMKVTLSCDHRVVDGATAAEFLQTFKQLLEKPVKMLV